MATYLKYLDAALKRANYEKMDDGRYFASIPEFDGLWAVGNTLEEATRELYSALDGWIDVHVKIGQKRPPVIGDVDLFAPPKLVEN
jgi:predicted RNase H-like HicB family nuclease